VKLVGGFCLYDKLSIHNHVKSLLAKNVTFVKHLHSDLARDAMPAPDELSLQSHYVNVLKESKTESVIHLEERPNY